MSARPRRRTGGFTLVELVAVIAIVAILAAYAAPLFIGSTTFAQRGFADELANALRLARTVAVATTCDVQVTINAGTYQAMQRAAYSGPVVAGIPPPACATSGAFSTIVRRSDGNTLSGYPPSGLSVPGNVSFTFTGADGSIASGAAPPATTVGAFSVAVGVNGWVSVQ
jgi:MSHA pilin protein MshC